MNWVDWHDGHWWMTFANCDLPIGPNKTPYGHKANTLMVKLTRDLSARRVVDVSQGAAG